MIKVRIITFFIFLGLFTLSFQIGAITPISDDDANSFVQKFLSDTQDTTGLAIFTNNAQAALPMFVPGFGIAWGIYTGWSTGAGFASMVIMAPALAEIVPLSILYMSPFGFMEIVAYSIAMSRSYHVIFSLVKKKNPKLLIKSSSIEIGIVIALLLIAGFLEEYMISMAQAS